MCGRQIYWAVRTYLDWTWLLTVPMLTCYLEGHGIVNVVKMLSLFFSPMHIIQIYQTILIMLQSVTFMLYA